MELTPVAVCENRRLGPGFWLSWERTFAFRPGQVVGLTLSPQQAVRWYSLASGNKDPWASVLYTEVEGGELTPFLAALKPHDTLYVTQPQGMFSFPPRYVGVATGTGIAPFLSAQKSGLNGPTQLLQGARSQDGLYFAELWREVLGERYLPCCSREKALGVTFGRVTDLLKRENLAGGEGGLGLGAPAVGPPRAPHFSTTMPYRLCGSAEMVVEARDVLIEKGVPFQQIVSEVYF